MKKLLSLILCLLLFVCIAVPARADSLTVPFTKDSSPTVGGKLTVDKQAMLTHGSITSEQYNALLEGNVMYSWYKNGVLTREGTDSADAHIYTLTQADQGCTVYVKVSFFEDGSFLEDKKCAEAVSEKCTIAAPVPKITTKTLPDATVGKAYSAKLKCSDPDAVFSEIMGSQLTDFGLYLTQHGEIEGIPTKAGNCHVNVLVVSEGGSENSYSFDMNIRTAAKPEETIPTTAPETVPETTVETTEEIVPETLDVLAPTAPQPPADPQTPAGMPWWGYALIILAAFGGGLGVTMLLRKKK